MKQVRAASGGAVHPCKNPAQSLVHDGALVRLSVQGGGKIGIEHDVHAHLAPTFEQRRSTQAGGLEEIATESADFAVQPDGWLGFRHGASFLWHSPCGGL